MKLKSKKKHKNRANKSKPLDKAQSKKEEETKGLK